MLNNRLDAWEPLSGGLAVAVGGADRVTADALLLAHFAAPCNGAVCDLGTGCGTVPLVLTDRGACTAACGVDVRPQACALLQAAVDRFGLQQRVTVLCADWREIPTLLPPGGFAAVTANPPYFTEGTGVLPADPARRAQRFGAADCFDTLCAAAAHLLADNGRFVCCVPPARVAAMTASIAAAGLHLHRTRRVLSAQGDFLRLLEAGTAPAAAVALPDWDLTDCCFTKELYGEE